MEASLQGRVALITGASGGLGTAVVEAFLAAGAQVAGVARSWPEPVPFHSIAADLAQPAAAAAAVEQTLQKFGRLDAAVHLLGGFAGGAPVQETSDEAWRRMLDLNLSPAFYFFRAALPPMLANGRGRLLAVGSRAGLIPSPGLSAYGVSKAALHMLITVLAAENKGTDITANAVLPGSIDTAANRAAMPGADAAAWVSPEAIGKMLVYLASDAAADVSGALIPIYGKS